MYLGITLNRLGDFANSQAAFKKALDIDCNDCTVHLNYAIVLYNNGHIQKAKEVFDDAEKIFITMDEEDKEPEMVDQRTVFMEALGIKA